MDGLQGGKELEDNSAEEEKHEEMIRNEVEDDPEEELEEDPEEEMDYDEEDYPEEEKDNEGEGDPEEEIDNEEEDNPEEDEISEGFCGRYMKDKLAENSGGISNEDQPVKELENDPKLESPLRSRLEDKLAPEQCSPPQKNSEQIKYLKSEYDCGSAASDQNSYELYFSKASHDGYSSGKQDGSGSLGKRRRSRWDQKPEGGNGEETVESDMSSKRRKTRWTSIDSQIKLLGPLQLPDFTKETVLISELDPEMQNVRDELVDIDYKLQRPVIHDERPEEEQSPSPEPLYNDIGIRINTREARLREKLIEQRQYLISRLIKKQPTFMTPKSNQTPRRFKKLYVPVKQYPGYNFVGLIIGPRGNTQKRMEKETGAKISLRGSGSFSKGKHASENDDLHVLIEADSEDSLDSASRMVEKLLTPIGENMNDHKRAQLKELAELKQYSKEQNLCYICGVQGHRYHACPHQLFYSPSISSDTSGGNNVFSDPGTMNLRESALHGKGTLCVNQLPGSADDHLLKELFCPFGNLIEAKVISEAKVGKNEGCGIVKFEDADDAAVAASCLNGFKFKGSRLAVKAVRCSKSVGLVSQKSSGSNPVSSSITGQTAWPGPPGSLLTEPQALFPTAHSYSLEGEPCLKNRADLFVSNLPDGVDENRLRELFCPFGRLAEAKVVRDGNIGRSKGCSSVRFDNPEDASMALSHLNGFELEGRVLLVSRNFPDQTTRPDFPLFTGHGSLLRRGPSFTVTPPSTGSSTFDIGSVNSFGSSNTFSDKSPFIPWGYMGGYGEYPDDQSRQFGAYFTAPDNRPSPPSQHVYTPESNVRPILWPVAP